MRALGANPYPVTLFPSDSPDALTRLASTFAVDTLSTDPSTDLNSHLLYLRMHFDLVAPLVYALEAIDGRNDQATLEDAGALRSEWKRMAPDWWSNFSFGNLPGALSVNVAAPVLRRFISYGFRVASAGMRTYEPDVYAYMLNSGKATKQQLDRDYVLRLGVLQGIQKVIDKIGFNKLAQVGAQSGLGEPVTLSVSVLVAIGIVVAAVAFILVAAITLVALNRLLDSSVKDCNRQFENTGTQSPLCQKLGTAIAEVAKEYPRPQDWADKLAKYGLIAGGAILAVVFLPEIVRSVKGGVKAARS